MADLRNGYPMTPVESLAAKAQREIAAILRDLELATGHVVKRIELVHGGVQRDEKDATFLNRVKVRISLFRVPGQCWPECAHG